MPPYAKENVPTTTIEPLSVARSVLHPLGSLVAGPLPALGTGSPLRSGSKAGAKFQTTGDKDRKGKELCRKHKSQ